MAAAVLGMLVEIGHFSLILALLVAAVQGTVPLVGASVRSRPLIDVAQPAALLQFVLNHRRLERSDHPERVGKTPAELLTGQSHPHWLDLLGYTRFVRA